MYIKGGIAYAGEQTPAIRVSGVKPIDRHKLWLRFNTGDAMFIGDVIPQNGENPENPVKSTVSGENP